MSQAPAAKTVIRTSITAALAITALAVAAAAPAQAAIAQRGDIPSPVTEAGGVGALLAPGPDLAGGLLDGALDGVTGLLPI